MPETEGGMKNEKDNIRNRALRLLQEMKAEHAIFAEEVRRRFGELDRHHKIGRETLTEHRDLLTGQDEKLAAVRSAIALVLSRLDEHGALFIEHAQKLETLQDTVGKPTKTDPNLSNHQERMMTDTIHDNGTHEEHQVQDWRSLSWSAIFFGTLAALAISVMLHILGLGVGVSAVDPNSRPSDALALIGGVTGIWFLVSTAISLFIGGFIASTLAHTFAGGRAAIYGLGVWALSTLLTMSVVVPALVKGAGNAMTAAGTIVDRAGTLLGAAGNTAMQAGQTAPAGVLDRFQRTLIGTPSGQVDQGAVQDITSLLGQLVTQGDWSAQQRDQLVNAVAKVANISPDDARRRVDEVQSTINSSLAQAQQKVRQAAEATRQAIATACYAAFGAMLVGLLAAFFGARYGELDEEHLPPFARIRLKGHPGPSPA